jgi:23S rRNA (cytosine1962-C5)-methyltransferase
MPSTAQIILKPEREKSVLARHPWIFSGAVQSSEGEPAEGAVVDVLSSSGKFLAAGHYHSRNIAVKIFSYQPVTDTASFWDRALGEAARLRSMAGLMENPATTAYRLVNAEGDGLPGLVVDIYNHTAVIQCQSLGMFLWRHEISEALRRLLGGKLSGVYDKSPDSLYSETSGHALPPAPERYLWGAPGDPVIMENGLRFLCDWERGQKTGFYIDQRDNRKLLEAYSRGRTVLNAFSYTAAFSVYALRGGAKQVCSVDSSRHSIEHAAQNIELNFPSASHRGETVDCFDFLKKLDAQYDLIIMDPPAFVKHQKALPRGLRGYESLNYQAVKQIAPDGIIFTFSCSELVSRELFRKAVANGASRAKRSVRVLHELGQSTCHPANLFHAEGEYLKGLVLAVT